ncbi:hypothetical protein CPC08DRAFT_632678 [Agrocybe pediades]|nr:hypothetical protein CPC08DRAFT_632678 [Agrocybe pediades]
MCIESLLNPEGEADDQEETSDKDIFEAVMHAKQARDNRETNVGDDNDDDIPCRPRSSYKEIFQAVAMIRSHTNNSTDPIARRLESALSAFTIDLRNTHERSKKDTVMTDYFSKQV